MHCYSIILHYGVNGVSTYLYTPASMTVLLDISAAKGSLVSAAAAAATSTAACIALSVVIVSSSFPGAIFDTRT